MSIETTYVVALVLVLAILGWLIFLTIKYRLLLKKTKIVFGGENPKKISKMIEEYFLGVEHVNRSHKELEETLKKTSKLAELSLTKTALIRYNPFGDVGSNQSFSLCLLNQNNDGFVISSIHSREGTRVYSKPVKTGESTFNLSSEEEKVIALAKQNKN